MNELEHKVEELQQVLNHWRYSKEFWSFWLAVAVGIELYAVSSGKIEPFTHLFRVKSKPLSFLFIIFWIWATWHLFFENRMWVKKLFKWLGR